MNSTWLWALALLALPAIAAEDASPNEASERQSIPLDADPSRERQPQPPRRPTTPKYSFEVKDTHLMWLTTEVNDTFFDEPLAWYAEPASSMNEAIRYFCGGQVPRAPVFVLTGADGVLMLKDEHDRTDHMSWDVKIDSGAVLKFEPPRESPAKLSAEDTAELRKVMAAGEGNMRLRFTVGASTITSLTFSLSGFAPAVDWVDAQCAVSSTEASIE